jgi:hypothetical protein
MDESATAPDRSSLSAPKPPLTKPAISSQPQTPNIFSFLDTVGYETDEFGRRIQSPQEGLDGVTLTRADARILGNGLQVGAALGAEFQSETQHQLVGKAFVKLGELDQRIDRLSQTLQPPTPNKPKRKTAQTQTVQTQTVEPSKNPVEQSTRGPTENSLQPTLGSILPNIAHRLKHGAGLRAEDAARSHAEVMQLFEKIPGTSKLGVSEAKIREFLADKHGSHIISRANGGSNDAHNIVWETGVDNLSRGATNMTGGEQVYIRFYNAADSILKNSATIASLGLAATGSAILTQTLITAAAYALDLYREDITAEEFKNRIVEAAVSAGITTPIFFVILIVVLALFPEMTLILSAPAVVAGFNLLFGMGVATPIVQSLIRHVQAGGFGQDVATSYDSLVNDTNRWIEGTTDGARNWAGDFLC